MLSVFSFVLSQSHCAHFSLYVPNFSLFILSSFLMIILFSYDLFLFSFSIETLSKNNFTFLSSQFVFPSLPHSNHIHLFKYPTPTPNINSLHISGSLLPIPPKHPLIPYSWLSYSLKTTSFRSCILFLPTTDNQLDEFEGGVAENSIAKKRFGLCFLPLLKSLVPLN